MHGFTERRFNRLVLSLFIILSMLILISPLLPAGAGEGEKVQFSRERVNPRSADEDTEFVFTVRITSAQPVREPVEVVIEGHPHRMSEVDPQDTNYSDGKDFEYREKFDRGPHVFFFRCGNQSTRARTFYVSHTRLIQYHPDLLLAMSLYLVPLTYIIHLLKKGTEHAESLTHHLRGIEKGLMSVNGQRDKEPGEHGKNAVGMGKKASNAKEGGK